MTDDVYCPVCDSRVPREKRFTHLSEEHPGENAEMRRLRETSDGVLAEPPSDLGHHGPHTWIPVDGRVMCGDCEAVLVDADPSEYP